MGLEKHSRRQGKPKSRLAAKTGDGGLKVGCFQLRFQT